MDNSMILIKIEGKMGICGELAIGMVEEEDMDYYRLELKYKRQPLPLGSGVPLSSQHIARVWTLRKVK
jgi:hypothetical protein